MNVLREKALNKSAALTNRAIRELGRVYNYALVDEASSYLKAAKKVADHFRIRKPDSRLLLTTKQKELPNVAIKLIKRSNPTFPKYNFDLNRIEAYNEPWSFMHEFAHAGNRTDILTKVKRALGVGKTTMSDKNYELLTNYLNEAYKSGNYKSKAIGQNIDDLISKALSMKERDTWRFLEEIRANANSYYDTKRISNPNNAHKIFQPLAIVDADYSTQFKKLLQQKGGGKTV